MLTLMSCMQTQKGHGEGRIHLDAGGMHWKICRGANGKDFAAA
jgi:hypothetical protein